MPRIARIVAAGVPHHVTQRGNRRQQTFFCEEDYKAYLTFMSEWCRKSRVEIWAYCLMPNHVHLIAVPDNGQGLRSAIGEAHKRYSRMVNAREGWKGHLWQGRFFSYPLDESHLLAAVRYIEMNPVRAGLVDSPDSYPWSSAGPHLKGHDDALVKARPLLDRVDSWRPFLSSTILEKEKSSFKRHERTGRPLGDPEFISQIEQKLNRIIQRRKPGPKPRKFYPLESAQVST
jgi:putative transposase